MRIHPTAIVDAKAEIGREVEIGPYCVIGAGVQLADKCWLQQHVSIYGPTRIGSGNKFFAYCSIGQQSQDLKYTGEPTYLEIGAGNTFREFVTVNRATGVGGVTRIADRGNFLAYSHIAHDCSVEDDVIFSNNGTLAGHVAVQRHAVLGGLTAVHQFCRIGMHSITGGCSKIVQDVPPFMIADGNPAVIRGLNLVGLERRGFSPEVLRELKEAFRLLYRAKLNTSQAVEEMRNSFPKSIEVLRLIEFLESSERGVMRAVADR